VGADFFVDQALDIVVAIEKRAVLAGRERIEVTHHLIHADPDGGAARANEGHPERGATP
jgi:hypothetical protein